VQGQIGHANIAILFGHPLTAQRFNQGQSERTVGFAGIGQFVFLGRGNLCVSFTLKQVHLIWRKNPPDDIFRIGPVLSLGSQ
jgi:hypothetical protein